MLDRLHTLMCHSEGLFLRCSKSHCLGLILLLWGSNIPLIRYGLFCKLQLQITYWTLTSLVALTFALASFFMSKPCLRLSTNRFLPSLPNIRVNIDMSTLGIQVLALSIVVPVVHGLIAFGLPAQVQRLSLQWVIYALIGLTFGTAADAINVNKPLARAPEVS
jgi:hypothetical protein